MCYDLCVYFVYILEVHCTCFSIPASCQEPKTQIALRNKDLILSCRAASTSPADMTFTWKKDNKVLQLSDCESGNRYSCCFGLTPFLL